MTYNVLYNNNYILMELVFFFCKNYSEAYILINNQFFKLDKLCGLSKQAIVIIVPIVYKPNTDIIDPIVYKPSTDKIDPIRIYILKTCILS
jgi:hypothetical protein